jgi:hypothetical protein
MEKSLKDLASKDLDSIAQRLLRATDSEVILRLLFGLTSEERETVHRRRRELELEVLRKSAES